MIGEDSLLVTLVRLVERIPVPPPPPKRPRGRPKTYPDRLFLKALVIVGLNPFSKPHNDL
jgi:hypothetical protein